MFGAYQALVARSPVCPRDVSIVGHNDIPLVEMVDPPLTTIRIDHAALGQEAASLVIDMIEGRLEEPLIQSQRPQLCVRASTATPPGRRP